MSTRPITSSRSLWALAGIFLIVLATYSNHFQNSFHFDDSHTVTDNPWIRDLRNIPRFFTDGTTFSALPSNRSYRPVVSTSLAIDYRLGRGPHPAWFHITTFFWYLVLLGLMFPVFRVTLDRAQARSSTPPPRNMWVALFAVLVYGVHPAMAETVNYVIQRGDLYSTLGVVAGFAVYLLAPEQRRYGLYLLPVLLGILSKPPAVVFPVLLFVWIWLFDAESPGAAAIRSLPALAASGGALAFVSFMNPPSYTAGATSAYSYRITQPWVLWGYFRRFFIPTGLSADTDQRSFQSPADGDAVFGFLFVLLILAAIWWCARRREPRPVAFGLAWFLIASAPTCVFALAEVENDHRMFFPFVGLALAACQASALWIEKARVPPKILVPACGLVVAGLAWGAHERNAVWNTEETLWRDVSVKSPNNGRGLMNYGLTQMAKGNYAASLSLFNRALALTPNYYVLEINLGIAWGATGNPAEAERHFARANALAPAEAGPHFYYARWLFGVHRAPEAIAQLQTAIQLNPDFMDAHYLLMQILAESGSQPALTAEAKAVLARFPGDATASSWLARAGSLPPLNLTAEPSADGYLNASLAYFQAGKFAECIVAAGQAAKLKPDSPQAWNNIGACRNALRQWDAGIAAEQQALRIQPDFQLAKNNLIWAQRQKRAGQ